MLGYLCCILIVISALIKSLSIAAVNICSRNVYKSNTARDAIVFGTMKAESTQRPLSCCFPHLSSEDNVFAFYKYMSTN